MSQNAPKSSWREAFEKHHRLLDEHLEIWRTIQRETQSDSPIFAVASTCLENTRSMVKACTKLSSYADKKKSEESVDLKSNHKRSSEDPEDQPGTKKAKKTHASKYVPPSTDPSGLFSIDVNPEPVDVLLKQNQQAAQRKTQKEKRGRSTSESVLLPSSGTNDVDTTRPAKKRKKTEHDATNVEGHQEIENHNTTFEQKVALRLKEKEEDRQKKANKKRKRESETSFARDEEGGEHSIEKPLTVGQVKQRLRSVEWQGELQKAFDVVRSTEPNTTIQDVKDRILKEAAKALRAHSEARGWSSSSSYVHFLKDQTTASPRAAAAAIADGYVFQEDDSLVDGGLPNSVAKNDDNVNDGNDARHNSKRVKKGKPRSKKRTTA